MCLGFYRFTWVVEFTLMLCLHFEFQNFATMEDAVFCGVFDGHGPFGHLVARRVRDSLPSKLLDFWYGNMAASKEMNGSDEEQAGLGDSRRTDYGSNMSTVYDTAYESAVSDVEDFSRELAREPPLREPPSMFSPWKESHLMAFKEMDQDLRTHPGIDTSCSGTTTVTVLKQVTLVSHFKPFQLGLNFCRVILWNLEIKLTYMLSSA